MLPWQDQHYKKVNSPIDNGGFYTYKVKYMRRGTNQSPDPATTYRNYVKWRANHTLGLQGRAFV